MNKRSRLFALSACVLLLLALSACQATSNNDVHLTIEVHADRSCTTIIEFYAPPVSDWLLNRVSETPTPEDQEPRFNLDRTVRESGEYVALVTRFDDVADLQNLINTASSAQNLMPWLLEMIHSADPEIELPDFVLESFSELPVPFSQFRMTVDPESAMWTTYTFEAAVNQTTSKLVTGFTRMTYHVRLPGLVDSHNADGREKGTLTWRLVEGQALDMRAHSRLSKLPGGNLTLWVGAPVALVLVAGAIVALVYCIQSRCKKKAQSSGYFDDSDALIYDSDDPGEGAGAWDAEYDDQDSWSSFDDAYDDQDDSTSQEPYDD